jgi:hypothetical protein
MALLSKAIDFCVMLGESVTAAPRDVFMAFAAA